MAGGAYDRLRAPADADPCGQAVLGAREDLLVGERRAGAALPGDLLLLQQGGEQLEALLEELLVVGEVEAEQRERLGERPAPGDDLGAALGDRVKGGEPLEDPHRVVGAEHGHRGAEPQPLGAGGDRGEHHLRAGDGEVAAVVLAHAEEVEPDLVGEHALIDDVPDHLRVVLRLALGVAGDPAEGVQAELDVSHAC